MTTRPDTATPSTWLTTEQAAAELQLTPRGVRRMISDGRLPAYRVGGRVLRIRRVDLDLITERVPTTRRRAS